MKVLIVGGSGLLGNRLSALLVQKGHEVIHLNRSVRTHSKYTTFVWDLDKGVVDATCLVGTDAVINLSGAGIADKRWTAAQKNNIIDSRVKGNALLLNTFRAQNFTPRKFVSAAAIGFYGNSPTIDFTEETPAASDGFLPYSCAKWEASIREIAQAGIPTAWIRIGIVLSTQGGALAKMLAPATFGLNTYFGSGQQFYSWVHIDDLCRQFMFLLDQESATGAYNGCSTQPIHNIDFIKIVAKEVSPVSFVLPVPAFLLRLVLGEMADVVLHGSKVYPARFKAAGFRWEFDELDMAIKDLWKRNV